MPSWCPALNQFCAFLSKISQRTFCCATLQLRLQGNAEARGGDLQAAERAYSKGIDLGLSRGKHLLHANRSGVRLTLGDAQGALEDAQAAAQLGPPTFSTAYIRQASGTDILDVIHVTISTIWQLQQYGNSWRLSGRGDSRNEMQKPTMTALGIHTFAACACVMFYSLTK